MSALYRDTSGARKGESGAYCSAIGDRSWIGIGAVVSEGVTIGADLIVGAGAVVIDDVEDGARVGGVPARPL